MKQEIKDRIEKIKNGEVIIEYKSSKAGVYPKDWESVKLGMISSFKQGFQISRHEQVTEYKDGYVRYLYISDFFSDKNKLYIKDNQNYYKINKEDLCVANTGNTGGKVFRGAEGVLSNNMFKIFPNEKINSDFYWYFLDSKYYWNQLLRMFNSGGQPHVGHKNMAKICINLPTRSEQQKIAQILSTWDKAIELKEKLIEQKKEQKKGLMQNLLTGKVRLPGFHGEWKEVKVGEVFERVTRKNTTGNTNVLTISAKRGLINQEDFFNKSVASSILDNYFLLYRGEFAYNKSYSNGYPMGAIKRLNKYESGVVTTLYICFRLKENMGLSADFFEQYFESGLLNRGLIQIAHEGGRAHGLLNVSPKDFFNLRIKIPEKAEQMKIGEILETADKEIKLQEIELENLKQQKKGLMQLLLTGIVRVK